VGAKQIGVLIFVTGSNEPLQNKPLEVIGEIVKEFTYARVVAITQNYLPAEVVSIMQFLFNIMQLRIELIVLCLPGVVQIFILYSHITILFSPNAITSSIPPG
jgi:hypothetical protein